jgi:hypothetical protein
MKKAVLSGYELYGLISTLIGLIGFIVAINEIQYRRRPDLSFLVTGDDFKEMALGGNDKPLTVQIINVETAYIMHNDQDVVSELTRITKDYPQYMNGYYSRGLIYLSKGNIEQGVADMQVVAKLSIKARLRQQAAEEIALARLAQVLTPLAFMGTIGIAMLYILATVGMKRSPWARSLWTAFKVISILFGVSFFFLLFH